MSRYRFARSPWWIVSHVFVLAMVLGMVRLGFWQLDRLDQKRERNAVVAERTEEPVADVRELGPPEAYASSDAAEQLEYRRAEAVGTYLVDEEVIVRSRSLEGSPGSWVLTPLELDDRTIVIVNRGWIPNAGQFVAVPDEFSAPEGEVTVTGLVRMTEERGNIGATDPSEGQLTDLARADIGRLDDQIEGDVLPFYLQLLEQDPEPAAIAPRPVPAPELDEGTHLSYAVQWFTFSGMTIVVYALILRKKARDLEREGERES
jgi:surfeit locus 1 family protein